jgi:hypothetical protein
MRRLSLFGIVPATSFEDQQSDGQRQNSRADSTHSWVDGSLLISYFLLIGRLHIFEHREEIRYEPRQHGAHRHHKQRRQHTEKKGERVSSPASAAFLFGSLARHGTQVFEVSAQRLPDAGAEALGLDENGHQLLRSSTPARSARLCNASARRLPARISRFRTANSSQISW